MLSLWCRQTATGCRSTFDPYVAGGASPLAIRPSKYALTRSGQAHVVETASANIDRRRDVPVGRDPADQQENSATSPSAGEPGADFRRQPAVCLGNHVEDHDVAPSGVTARFSGAGPGPEFAREVVGGAVNEVKGERSRPSS